MQKIVKEETKQTKTGQYFFRGLFIRVEAMNAEIQRRVFTFMGGNYASKAPK